MAAIFIQATYIMIPLFLQMNKLNLLNSLTALGVLYATMQFLFAIFLLTGFLLAASRAITRKLPEEKNSIKRIYLCKTGEFLHGKAMWQKSENIFDLPADAYKNPGRTSFHKGY